MTTLFPLSPWDRAGVRANRPRASSNRLAGLDPVPTVGRGRRGGPFGYEPAGCMGVHPPSPSTGAHVPTHLRVVARVSPTRPRRTPLQRRPPRGRHSATAWLDVSGFPPATPHRGYRIKSGKSEGGDRLPRPRSGIQWTSAATARPLIHTFPALTPPRKPAPHRGAGRRSFAGKMKTEPDGLFSRE